MSSSFHSVIVIFGTTEQHVFTLRRTATINEYELTTAANNRLLRHRFGREFCLHAQPANQVLSLIKIIVNDGLECDKRKKFTATDFFLTCANK